MKREQCWLLEHVQSELHSLRRAQSAQSRGAASHHLLLPDLPAGPRPKAQRSPSAYLTATQSCCCSEKNREGPKCHVTIEKDGGCNHMVCRNQNCKAEFCWVCLGPWEPHGSAWYNCNRYNEDDAKAARDAQERSRAALQRYLFYCNRYMNHMQSLRFEHKLYAQVKQKMEEMQQHNMSWIEVQFLKKAVDVLCQCRATLMYTYVFAFYLKKNNQSIIFENNQADLENATEVLSGYLERDISQDSLQDIKQKVQDKYRYCESRRRVLLQHVHEGYEKDLWEYIED
ncbi:PREDICTED: E3 ubiquitin-protein ligase ARIH1-like [Phaethon lepturus]|uniref:E3 ubiquitin-protein ligase ARIH1-like n=1 Tax=Phaethon lepturus TaxID=97097 RepID=UPI000530B4F2|nr:PREDICTED: E3 ubiquitin-protein ligase ARIH1-like [Phaethon lepturus]